MADKILFLTPASGRIATKRFDLLPDGNISRTSYGNAQKFHVQEFSVSNIRELHTLLKRKSHDPYSFMVRGKLIDGFLPGKHIVRRLLSPRIEKAR